MTTQLITAHYGTMPVLFQTDAFINATAIAKQFNKNPKDYLKSKRTQEYIEAVRTILLTEQNQLVIIKQGGSPEEQGTWLHPKLAVDFARWLDVRFAVWCDLQIEKILHSRSHSDSLAEFLKPLIEPISLEDFDWRYQAIEQAYQNLRNAKIAFILSGSELLVGRRKAKTKRLF